METVVLDGNRLTLEEVRRVAQGAPVALAPKAVERIQKSRELVEQVIREGKVVYGVNTGFGKFSEVTIPGEKLDLLQENLILSHAAGVGPALSEEVVRAVLCLKINTLAKGFSGCRLEIVNTLVQMLNRGVHPVIPEKGSVGASGDLAPLAHMTLVMMGLGEAYVNGHRMSGRQAMAEREIAPVRLKAKEGLALLNGTQVMTAIGALTLLRSERLATAADIIGALSTEALMGTPVAFDERIHQSRGLRGQIQSAANLRRLVEGSEILAHRPEAPKVQDAYSLRCMPQVHGATRDTLAFVRSVLQIEINGATDNPLVLVEEGRIVSGGNFHGQPVSQACDYLAIAVAALANISERRIEYLCDPATSDLAGFLTPEGGLNSGFMIPQVTAASLVAENKVLTHPASVDSIPTSANKEDHVSMGAHSARKASEVVHNSEYVLGIELLCAGQGVDFRKPLKPGRGTDAAFRTLRKYIPYLERDRLMYPDIEKARELISSGELIEAVESVIGELD